MGLWLTIDLEQYDSLESFDNEYGIRVSICKEIRLFECTCS
jgi:hypothetical protein